MRRWQSRQWMKDIICHCCHRLGGSGAKQAVCKSATYGMRLEQSGDALCDMLSPI